jgi:hypothetical protein
MGRQRHHYGGVHVRVDNVLKTRSIWRLFEWGRVLQIAGYSNGIKRVFAIKLKKKLQR